MKTKTSELTGLPLRYAVALAEGIPVCSETLEARKARLIESMEGPIDQADLEKLLKYAATRLLRAGPDGCGVERRRGER